MYNHMHDATDKTYRTTRKLISISLSFIVIYLISSTLSFYLFVFAHLPSASEAVLVEIIMLMLGYIFQQWYTKSKNVSVSTTIDLPSPAETPDKPTA
jgi:hypothetical protein